MRRLLGVVALGVVLGAVPLAGAEEAGKDEVRKLQADLARLRKENEELKARLDKVKEALGQQERRPGGRGWGRFNPEKLKEMRERHKKGRPDADRRPGGKKPEAQKGVEKGKERPPFRRGWGPGSGRRFGMFGRFQQARRSSDLEQRLDRVLKELEELRRDLRKR